MSKEKQKKFFRGIQILIVASILTGLPQANCRAANEQELIKQFYSNPKTPNGTRVLRGLGKIHTRPVVSFFNQLLESRKINSSETGELYKLDRYQVLEVVKGMARFKEDSSIPSLSKALCDSDSIISNYAYDALMGFRTSLADKALNDHLFSIQYLINVLEKNGLQYVGSPPRSGDLNGDGKREYWGWAVNKVITRIFNNQMFYIIGEVNGKYTMLYTFQHDYSHFLDEKFIDFNNDGLKDYYFRYGDNDYDYGYVLVWNHMDKFENVYKKNDPYFFKVVDLDEDGISEIVQMEGPFSGPQEEGPVWGWSWKDIHKWYPDKGEFVLSNDQFPDFYRQLKEEYEALLAQLNSQNVPGYSWKYFENSLLELKTTIEKVYLPRIDKILEDR